MIIEQVVLALRVAVIGDVVELDDTFIHKEPSLNVRLKIHACFAIA